jgi:hypothetical protein
MRVKDNTERFRDMASRVVCGVHGVVVSSTADEVFVVRVGFRAEDEAASTLADPGKSANSSNPPKPQGAC